MRYKRTRKVYHRKIRNKISEILKVPNSAGLYKVIAIALKRREDDLDTVIGITGAEGSGKSSLGIILCANYDPKFAMRENIIFEESEDAISLKLRDTSGRAYSIDEAVDVAYKGEWQSKIQVTLNKVFTKMRKKNHLICLCMPSIHNFNTYFRQGRLFMNIEIVERGKKWGYAIVYIRNQIPRDKDPFQLELSDKTQKEWIEKFGQPKTLAQRLKLMRQLPCYAFEFRFPKLPDWIEDEYLLWHTENEQKNNSIYKTEPYAERTKKRMIGLASMFYFLTQLGIPSKEAEIIAGVDNGYLYDIIRENQLSDRIKSIVIKNSPLIKKKLERIEKQHEYSLAITEKEAKRYAKNKGGSGRGGIGI